ncbi:hypothetical protein HY095_06335 [Candidatus Micrarchaeota archaeon]|nr:hypothetical protein [Candidatus Micrarchaeota archaeon]
MLAGIIMAKGAGKTPIGQEGSKAKIAVLLIAAVALLFCAKLVSYGSLAQPMPNTVQSIDAVTQLVQIEWMAASQDNSASPAFNPAGASAVNAYLPPFSIVPQAIWVQASGAQSWNANSLFLALVYAAFAMAVFLLFRKVFGPPAGVAAAASTVIPPALAFVSPFYFGLWRVVFSFFLVPLIIYFSIKTIETKGSAAGVLALLLLLLSLTHPYDIPAVAASVALVAIYAVTTRENLGKIAIPIAAALALFAILALPLIPRNLPGVGDSPLKAGSVISPDASWVEKDFGFSVGKTIIRFGEVPIWLYAFLLIGAVMLANSALNSKKEDRAANSQAHLALNMLVFSIAVSGFVPYLSEYVLKGRFVMFADFLIPLAAVGVLVVCTTVLEWVKVRQAIPAIAISIASLTLLASPWAYPFPDITKNPIKGTAWEALSYLKENSSEGTKILFLTYFRQESGCLSGRRCFEGSLEDIENKSERRDYSPNFQVYAQCSYATRKTGALSYSLQGCDDNFGYSNICNYDYIVIAHYPQTGAYTQELANRLEKNYELVFNKDGFTVQKRAKATQNCLP